MDAFTRQYIETALWSSHDESTPAGGNPMDENYSADDLAPETLAKMAADCAKFQADNQGLIDAAWFQDNQPTTRTAYDFWLTRNGHGAGFWDGDYPVTGDALTAAAKLFPSVDLYVGDDGKIYQI